MMRKSIIKKFLLIWMVVFSLMLTSCYFDNNKKAMELIEIKVYDIAGIAVIGEVKNYSDELYRLNSQSNWQATSQKLNSPAPVFNYYYVSISEEASYTIEFIFESKKGYEMKLLKIRAQEEDTLMECSDITTRGGKIIVKFFAENVNPDYHIFTAKEWIDDKDQRHYFSAYGGNVYLRGIYFDLTSDKD